MSKRNINDLLRDSLYRWNHIVTDGVRPNTGVSLILEDHIKKGPKIEFANRMTTSQYFHSASAHRFRLHQTSPTSMHNTRVKSLDSSHHIKITQNADQSELGIEEPKKQARRKDSFKLLVNTDKKLLQSGPQLPVVKSAAKFEIEEVPRIKPPYDIKRMILKDVRSIQNQRKPPRPQTAKNMYEFNLKANYVKKRNLIPPSIEKAENAVHNYTSNVSIDNVSITTL